jgi:phenylacetic acid degradation operon negative regulatory protein
MAVHPQSLFLALVGQHLLDESRLLSGASVVFVMKRLGVGESAARSVLQRMTAKGLVVRHKDGRKTFYSLSDKGQRILREGQVKMYSGWQPQSWDGQWTLVRVQVPETKRTLRHRISSTLSWAGFGQVDGSTWVSPGSHDVAGLLGSEAGEIAPIVIVGKPQPPTNEALLVAAFDLKDLASGYAAFGDKWRAVDVQALTPTEALVRRVELHFDWLGLTRTDPQLPVQLLPDGWPGTVQGQLFKDLDSRLGAQESSLVPAFFAGELPNM